MNQTANRDDDLTPEMEDKLTSFGTAMRTHMSITDRVLNELDQPQATSSKAKHSYVQRKNTWFGELTMTQKIAAGSLTAVVMGFLCFFGLMSNSTVSFAQVLENASKATSYSVDVVFSAVDRDGREQDVSVGRIYWRLPNDFRIEFKSSDTRGKSDRVTIAFADRPGVELDRIAKTHRELSARQGERSPLMYFQSLMAYTGSATKELGTRNIGGVECKGFELAASEIDPNLGNGTILVWVDTKKQLPVEFEMVMPGQMGQQTMSLRNFAWNKELASSLFDVQPPSNYRLLSPTMRDPIDQVAKIVSGLEIFAKLSGGEYPQVKVIYGDVIMNKMLELSGLADKKPEFYVQTKEYGLVQQATEGFSIMTVIMRDSADASYHGLTVGPNDKDKTLFRWKLDDGSYQIIYGDLRSGKE